MHFQSKSPPNFRVKADFTSYSKPVVTVHEPEPVIDASHIENDPVLVDFTTDSLNSSHSSQNNNNNNNYILNDNSLQQQLYIQQLLQEIEKLRAELDRIQVEVKKLNT